MRALLTEYGKVRMLAGRPAVEGSRINGSKMLRDTPSGTVERLTFERNRMSRGMPESKVSACRRFGSTIKFRHAFLKGASFQHCALLPSLLPRVSVDLIPAMGV